MEKSDIKWIIAMAIVCFVVFANSVGGEFVYDDISQIVRNTLIQDNSLIWKALSSDVWAFNGGGTQAVSNYWRPSFTLWLIVNFKFFGLNPLGWHVTNLILHSGVCVVAYALLRRWTFSAATAFTITILFAVHPVHVESVAWLSGSPDLIFSLAFLGSLWFATSYRESRLTKHLLLTALLYAFALGAKEIGIICLPIYYFVLTDNSHQGTKKAAANSLPVFVLSLVAVGYFLVRWSVLGSISRPNDEPVAVRDAIMSVPAMFAFYLRQIFAPFSIAINYPLQPVTEIGVTNFAIPLVVSCLAIAGIIYLVITSSKMRLAAAIFLLPLIPTLNATMFDPEQIVHDRYLYLPLLGALMILVPLAARLLNVRIVLIAGCVIAVALAVQTYIYNTAWANNLTLWTWTSAIDDSPFTLIQLGHALSEAERHSESIAALSTSIAKKPTFRAYIGRARGYIALKQYANAENDLLAALALPKEKQELYAMYQIYETLGIAYVEQRKYDAAVKNYRDARTELPNYSAALTGKLAVALTLTGQKSEALRELENARVQARTELLPESKTVFLLLGMLYNEAGRKDDARAALNEYLKLTESIKVTATLDNRSKAARLLETLQ